MEKEKNLKAQNTPQLWVFLSANILFLFGMIFPAYFIELPKEFDLILIFKVLGASIAPLLLFLLNGLLSSHQKAILVFWRFKHPLPGSEAFTKLSKNDHRIDRDKLKEIHGTLPKGPKQQNKLWYRIYKKNSSSLIIQASQGGFLLARDLTSLAVLFVIFLGIPVLIIATWPINFYYLILLILQYLVISRGARIRGRRFVNNVLAIESSQAGF
jgi:hypothetical protein